MDKSAQMDELDSLKSIYYSEEFQVTGNLDDTGAIQAIFWAHNKLPDDYVIKYIDAPGSHDASYMKIKHLPPIELRLTFPEDYPSQNPPKFSISCQWLPKSKIALLCKKLDALWSEYGPAEIVFIWCDFLKNDLLNYLDCENELDLRELCSKHLSFIQKLERCKDAQNSSALVGIPNIVTLSDSTNSHVEENKCNPGTSNNFKLNIMKEYKDSHNKYKKEFPDKKQKPPYKNLLDVRAVLDLNIKTSPLRHLENYNLEREKVQFLKNFYTCKICFSDKLGKDCTKFHNCDHVFCISCIESYFTIKIKDGTVQSIKCPEDKCPTEALPSQIKEIVSEELFARYDTVLLKTALDTLGDIIYCPRPLCQYPVSWEAEEKMASCPNCQYVFCVKCKMVYHGVEPCHFKSAEVRKLVEQYEKASGEVKSQLETKYGKKQLETLVSNTKAELWIEDNSKACPQCKVAIEKAHGCNKMVCWKCNAFFCWLCSTLLDKKDPYFHFKDPHSQCANKLFHMVVDDEDDFDPWDFLFRDDLPLELPFNVEDVVGDWEDDGIDMNYWV